MQGITVEIVSLEGFELLCGSELTIRRQQTMTFIASGAAGSRQFPACRPCFRSQGHALETMTWTWTSGSGTWVAPGTGRLTLTANAAGGGGGSSTTVGGGTESAWGGGSGGFYKFLTVNVHEGDTLLWGVGVNGIAGLGTGAFPGVEDGTDGGDLTVVGTLNGVSVSILCHGGHGGPGEESPFNDGAGGTATGPGFGLAIDGNAGLPPSGNKQRTGGNGGGAPNGGVGGTGGPNMINGTNGSPDGGGGGGGGRRALGGNGAQGRLTLVLEF